MSEKNTQNLKEFLQTVAETSGGTLKFSKGVMGKSTVVICLLLVMGIICVIRSPWLAAIGVLVFLTVVAGSWYASIINFSIKHPDLSLLDGAEWSHWKIYTTSMGTKDNLIPNEEIKNLTKIENPDKT